MALSLLCFACEAPPAGDFAIAFAEVVDTTALELVPVETAQPQDCTLRPVLTETWTTDHGWVLDGGAATSGTALTLAPGSVPRAVASLALVSTTTARATVTLGSLALPESASAFVGFVRVEAKPGEPPDGVGAVLQRGPTGAIVARLNGLGQEAPGTVVLPATTTLVLELRPTVATLTVGPTELRIGGGLEARGLVFAVFGAGASLSVGQFELALCGEAACNDGACGTPTVCQRRFCNPAMGCGQRFTTATCDDLDPCTAGDACAVGTCAGATATDCDDGVACTIDACEPATGCTHQPVAAACDDGNLCTGAESCDPTSGCAPGLPPTCVDDNPCNGVEFCHPLLGCVVGVPPACDDKNPCNGTESCDAKLGCVGGTAPTCDDKNPCNGTESCDAALGCVAASPPVCSDGDPCNGVESCDATLGCVSGQALECSDGNACNGAETCLPGQGCAPGLAPTCNDQNPCNGFESCDPKIGCITGVPVVCDDGLPCNGQESCHPTLGCIPGAALPGCCTAQDQCDDGNPCNGISTCQVETATCTATAPIACSDGNPCNGLEVCLPAQGCVSGNALVCGDGDVCNGLESCAPEQGCVPGTPLTCDDGLPCTGDEVCHPISGCLGGKAPSGCCTNDLDCNDLDFCNGTGSCTVATGTCVIVPPATCDDANVCNGAESCVPALGCVSGTLLDCDDGDLCDGQEVCHPALGCLPGLAPACSDGNPCNGQESCDGAAGCLPGTPLQCGDDNVCNGQELCAPFFGCIQGLGLTCGDGNACNGHEGCDPKLGCVAGKPPTCSDGNVCNGVESCEPAVGCIGGKALTCADGNACNGVETCDAGLGCVAGTPPTCEDDNACNGVESCDPAAGCVGGKPVVCSDGNACNGVETCDAELGCIAGTPPDCDDGNACNGVESCVPATGCVGGQALVCDDGNVCNGVEPCAPSTGCGVGAPLVCNDKDACNGLETCDTAEGCVAGVALVCSDGNACNGAESCVAALGCVAGTPPKCDDGNPCNGQETCAPSSGCVSGTPVSCSDGNHCNGEEGCDPAAGCTPGKPPVCDDANACNGQESCVAATGCQSGTPLVCGDGNACNGQESCNATQGCVAGAPPDCVDQNPCNGIESCSPGLGCVPGTPLSCDDQNPCTDDACDPAATCTHLSVVRPCDDGVPCTHTDTCTGGACFGTAYVCADGHACTDDVCVGDGTCAFAVKAGSCLIGGACVADGAPDPSGTCLGCVSDTSSTTWVADDRQTCGPLPGALDAKCAAGVCVPDGCSAGFHDCVADVPGCETHTLADPKRCGSCQKQCTSGQVCSGGLCKAACDANLTKCGQSCVDLTKDSDHCGGCSKPCLLANTAVTACTASTCKVVACYDGYVDANLTQTDGCECTIQHGGLELCNGKDDDCDGLVDDAPASVVDTDLKNCGACGKVCPPGPTSHLATCAQGSCGLSACGAGLWNIDGKVDTGCEYACVPAANFTELCNAKDDDCDGVTDEGFDLLTDATNCGTCGLNCTVLPNVVQGRCAFGTCKIDQCAEGWKNADGAPANGCEAVPKVVWVDDSNAADTAQDGSSAHPWSTIAKGTTASGPGDEIRLRPGVYAEAVTLSKAGVRLMGEGAALITITPPALGTGILVGADAVSIENVTVKGGRIGIQFNGPSGSPRIGGRVEGVVVRDQAGKNDTADVVLGIEVRYTSDVTVTGSTVQTLKGSGYVTTLQPVATIKGATGGAARGIMLVGSSGCTITGNTITGVTAGAGQTTSSGYSGEYPYGGLGGSATGLYLEGGTGNVVTGNTIANITGGAGGNGRHAGGRGGDALGMAFRLASTENGLKGNTITTLTAGAGGTSLDGTALAGASGGRIGMSFASDSINNDVAMDNKVDGTPIVFLYGAKDVVIEGLTIPSKTMPTNFGMFTVLESTNVTVRGNTIVGAAAAPGDTSPSKGGTGSSQVGLRIQACTECLIEDNVINSVTGAVGGGGDEGGVGGAAYGLYIINSTGVVARRNTITGVTGGKGGSAKPHCGNDNSIAGTGGGAYGMYVSGCIGSVLDGNSVRTVSAGLQGSGISSYGGCNDGTVGAHGYAAGTLIANSVTCALTHHEIHTVRDVSTINVNEASLSGLDLQNVTALTVQYVTIYSVYSAGANSTSGVQGVRVPDGQTSPILIQDSIVSIPVSSGVGIRVGSAVAAGLVVIDATTVHVNSASQTVNATLNATCLSSDPQFVSAATGDLSLKATSPCIDKAAPDSDYCLEPSPNGCRANMGAHGNTADATSKAGASHCSCAP